MVNAITTTAMGRWLILALYAMIFFQIIFAIIAASVVLVREGDVMPLVNTVGGTLFAAENQLDHDVSTLIDTDLHSTDPTVYDATYMEFLRNDIIRQVMIIGFMFYLFFKVYNWLLGGEQKDNVFKPVGAILLALFTMALLEWVFVFLSTGNHVVPGSGIYNFFVNIGKIWVLPTGQAITTGTGLVS